METLSRLLSDSIVANDVAALAELAEFLNASARQRTARRTTLPGEHPSMRGWIRQAQAENDFTESVWRTFLWTHYGQDGYLRKDGRPTERESAEWLLCGGGDIPRWTYATVSQDEANFIRWLYENSVNLQELRFGNHRKYESKAPDGIAGVVRSFLLMAENGLIQNLKNGAGGSTPAEQFDRLFTALTRLKRFGRLGGFDFLILLNDLGLTTAEPGTCYLSGSTGPLWGARKIWGTKYSTGGLDRKAAEFARSLNLPAAVVEDALCNWQKKGAIACSPSKSITSNCGFIVQEYPIIQSYSRIRKASERRLVPLQWASLPLSASSC